MEQDDLPPEKHSQAVRDADESETGAESLGELFGASLWIALFVAVAGGGFYLFLRLTH